ncbi:hypothetical protein E2C01_097809 [Portunus trituberculatus]|uniref:Uncharacterized protein n=1 Tax=Portunus trituberculatus TaxID=210409 RepID=A0A5B7KB15_PORTR|nr:hypothetical protein [Portunus trituberculatus]
MRKALENSTSHLCGLGELSICTRNLTWGREQTPEAVQATQSISLTRLLASVTVRGRRTAWYLKESQHKGIQRRCSLECL